jgi:ADP-heptose:LPS heptosyltransferase
VQLDFLRDAGIRWAGDARRGVALRADDLHFAATCLRSLGYAPERRPGGVLPGGSWPGKRWTAEGFVEAGRALARSTGAPALVLWGPPERETAEAIAAGLGADGRLAPPTELRQMAALIARLALLVAPDCLGRHLAIVQEVPTVGVFASTDPKDWTPPSGPHRVVRLAASGEAPGEHGATIQVVAEIEASSTARFLDTPA